MSQHAPPPPVEPTSMELETSATNATAPDAAAAAAAAALVALPQPAAAAAGTPMQRMVAIPCCSSREMVLTCAPVIFACCAVGVAVQAAASGPARYCNWERGMSAACSRQLRGQPLERNGDGYCCKAHKQAQRNAEKRATAAAAAPAAPAAASASVSPARAVAPRQTRKRHADSDPGEQQQRARPLTRRVTPPKHVQKKQRHGAARSDADIMRLLDETHKRRMAALAQQ
jgi:hypothetical protein